MKTFFFLSVRWVIAAIFIVSGFEKLVSPTENFIYVLRAYDVVADGLVGILAAVFPWVELTLGVFLALGFWLRPVLLALAGVATTLMVVVGQAIARHLPIDDCGCFGNLVHWPLEGVIFLDMTILACVLGCLGHMACVRRFSLDSYLDSTRL